MKATHQRVWELLAWYVNGSASADERRLVEQHLAECADCRAEHEAQRQLHDHLARERGAVPDVEAGLARLMGDIDRPAPRSAEPPRVTSSQRWRWAAAGLAAMLVLETGALVVSAQRQPQFQTLSTPDAGAARAAIRLVPAPTMTVGELQAQLRTLQLTIVAGPTEAGVYSLAYADGKGDSAAALARLRATPGVLFAEPVGEVR